MLGKAKLAREFESVVDDASRRLMAVTQENHELRGRVYEVVDHATELQRYSNQLEDDVRRAKAKHDSATQREAELKHTLRAAREQRDTESRRAQELQVRIDELEFELDEAQHTATPTIIQTGPDVHALELELERQRGITNQLIVVLSAALGRIGASTAGPGETNYSERAVLKRQAARARVAKSNLTPAGERAVLEQARALGLDVPEPED